MLKNTLPFALVLAVAACGGSPPPAATPLPEGALIVTERVQPPPVHALLGYRTELNLSSEQVAALDSIGQAIFAAGDTVRTQMMERQAQQRGRRDTRGTPALIESLTALSEQNRLAQEAVQEVLTDEQEARVCQLFERDRNRRAAPAPRARQDRSGRTVQLPPMATRVWSWCAPSS
jgi:hypothetical protein